MLSYFCDESISNQSLSYLYSFIQNFGSRIAFELERDEFLREVVRDGGHFKINLFSGEGVIKVDFEGSMEGFQSHSPFGPSHQVMFQSKIRRVS